VIAATAALQNSGAKDARQAASGGSKDFHDWSQELAGVAVDREVSAQAVEKGLICQAHLDEVFGMQCLRHASAVAK
jgi:hypothetical protein